MRRALGDDSGNPRFLETIPRRGYRLIVPVNQPAEGLLSTETGTAHSVVMLEGCPDSTVPMGFVRTCALPEHEPSVDLSVTQNKLALTLEQLSGSIWVLDNADQ